MNYSKDYTKDKSGRSPEHTTTDQSQKNMQQ